MNPEVFVWVAVFVLSINSAINPFLFGIFKLMSDAPNRASSLRRSKGLRRSRCMSIEERATPVEQNGDQEILVGEKKFLNYYLFSLFLMMTIELRILEI